VIPPLQARTVFGDRLPLAERFAHWLIGAATTRGLLGPREGDQIWERHLLNGVAIAALIEPESVVIDLGSGAGLPGIPLLLARPDLQMILVDSKARRAEFLSEVCADLKLDAAVVRARATADGLVTSENTTISALPEADVVTARAVAPLGDLGRWAAALLRPGGRLLAVKGATATAELSRDLPLLESLGFLDARVLTPGAEEEPGVMSGSTPPTTVIAMTLDRVSRET